MPKAGISEDPGQRLTGSIDLGKCVLQQRGADTHEVLDHRLQTWAHFVFGHKHRRLARRAVTWQQRRRWLCWHLGASINNARLCLGVSQCI
mmetsp:Transcript_16148/g.46087  ORF Transcript_16148/g.46087 Transcript_16148/m.46087 type:complete len:91 (+) Transcript_16148:136-408(+)